MNARLTASLALAFLTAQPALAGDVAVSVQRETLILRGDDLGADLLLGAPVGLSRGGAGATVVVTPQGTTTVNGAGEAATFGPIEDVKIALGDGPGVVRFEQLSLPGSLSFKSGGGPDTLFFVKANFGDASKVATGEGPGTIDLDADSSFGDDLSVRSGGGPDTLVFGGAVAGSLKVNQGAGPNTVLGEGSVGDDFSQKGGDGFDTLDASGFAVTGNVRLRLGPGDNALILDAGTQIGETLRLKGGPGVDAVTANAAQIGETLNLNLAAGNNTVSLTDTQVGQDLVVKAGRGDDTVQILGTTAVAGSQRLNLDGGTNVAP